MVCQNLDRPAQRVWRRDRAKLNRAKCFKGHVVAARAPRLTRTDVSAETATTQRGRVEDDRSCATKCCDRECISAIWHRAVEGGHLLVSDGNARARILIEDVRARVMRRTRDDERYWT